MRDLRQRLVLAEAKAAGADEAGQDDGADRRSFGPFNVVARVFDGISGKDLGVLGDQERDKVGSGAVLLISKLDSGKQAVIVAVSKDAVGKLHAGKTMALVAAALSGRGGGRPDFAQGGGNDAAGVEAALAAFWGAAEAAFGEATTD